MNYTTLQTTISGIATGLATPLVAGVICDTDTHKDLLTDRSFTFYLVSDSIESRNAEEVEVVRESWILQAVYVGGPEEWAARMAEARADARLIRNGIEAISLATLNSIADSGTSFESVQIRTGNVQHDNSRQREGILVMSLPVLVTWVM